MVPTWIRVDQDLALAGHVVIPQQSPTGHIEEEISGGDHLRDFLTGHSPSAAIGVTEVPSPPEAGGKCREGVLQKFHGVHRIINVLPSRWVVGLPPGVLEVVNLEPQPLEPQGVLGIVPDHSAHGITSDHSSDDRLHLATPFRPRLESSALSLAPTPRFKARASSAKARTEGWV